MLAVASLVNTSKHCCPLATHRSGGQISAQRNRVVLFSPPYQGKVFGPPLGLLSLAASIREEGFRPVIIDGAISPNFLDLVASEVEDAFAFGISVLTGPMIREAIAASQIVRRGSAGFTDHLRWLASYASKRADLAGEFR